MANPAFGQSPAFSSNNQRAAQADYAGQTYGQQPQIGQPYQQQGGQPQFGAQGGQQAYGQQPQQYSADNLNQMYDRPSADAYEAGRLTYDGVITKTAFTLGMVAVGFVLGIGAFFSGNQTLFTSVVWGGAIVGLILALVNIFKKEPSPALIVGYALAQGLFLGGLSAGLEWGTGGRLSGIIFQALLATACVFGATLALYAFRIVRTSPRLTKIFFIIMIAYALFSVVNLVLVLTGTITEPWGLRNATVFGIPLGLLLGVLAVLLGAYSLVMDFEAIEQGVKRGVHKKYGWSAAFGLTMTIIWLYVEILRIIAIMRGNN